MADPARARKLADRIKVVVAESLERRVKDPRLGFITVTDTRVTGDLQHATVFYTVLGDESDKASTAAALESAKGRLRSEVGKAVGIRLTPHLEFVLDAVPETAQSIADLLAAAAAQDAEVAALAIGKQHAGDPDPYKHPELDEVDDHDDDDDEDDDDEDEDAPGALSIDGESLDPGSTDDVDDSPISLDGESLDPDAADDGAAERG